MNLRSSPTTGQLRAIGKLVSSHGDSETQTQKFANREAWATQHGRGRSSSSRGSGRLRRSPKLQDSILYSGPERTDAISSSPRPARSVRGVTVTLERFYRVWVRDWVHLRQAKWLPVSCKRHQIGHLDFWSSRLLTEGLLSSNRPSKIKKRCHKNVIVLSGSRVAQSFFLVA